MPLFTTRKPRPTAHSLVELLVVVGIIGILVSLIAPAASRVYAKAKAMEWENNGYPWKLEKQLRPFYSRLKEYPEISPKELYENGVIDASSLKFLNSSYVEFQPFSSKTPTETVVLRFGWNKEFEHAVTKEQLTAPTKK